ncbi:MAG: phage portal protein [Clostridia bacterium]|nr:phage portal protein [Clostridia bacterium]
MSFWNRIFKNSALTEPEKWLVEALGCDRKNVNEETALQVCACFACVRVLSEQTAMLPLNVYQRKDNGGRIKRTDLYLHRVLNEEPNPYMTAFDFWRMMMVNLVLCGAAYAEIERDPRTREPKYLWPIPRKYVEKKRHPSGEPYWKVKVPIGGVNGVSGWDEKLVPFGNMLELTGLSIDGVHAIRPVQLLKGALSLSIEAERYSNEYFENGAHPSGTVEYPGKLKGDNLDTFKKNIREAYSGLGNQHRVILLEEGMKFTRIASPPNEGQMFESRKFQVIEIARFFNVPPAKIMDLERATYNNMEEMNAQFADESLGPYLINIKQEVMKDLLFDFQKNRENLYVEHDLNSLLKGKLLDRYKAYAMGRQWGFLSINEIRSKENADNIGKWGDRYLEPTNMAASTGGEK